MIKNFFAIKFLIYIACTSLGFCLMLSENGIYAILGIIIHGIFNAHGIQLLHQASHYRAFKNRNLNDAAGVIIGLNAFIPFHQYRKKHNLHHSNLGTKNDSEFFEFEKINDKSSPLLIIRSLFNLNLIRNIISNLESFHSNKSWSEIILSLFIVAFFVCCVFTSTINLFVFWISSNILITGPIHYLIEIPEHFGCSKLSIDKTKNTRSILNPTLITKWFTNWNNFHSEHHMYPHVLPENLHKYLVKNRAINNKECMDNYIEFYIFYLKALFRGLK